MPIKKHLVRILKPGSKPFLVLHGLRHPVATYRKLRMAVTKSSIFDNEEDLHGCSLLPTPLLEGVLQVLKPSSVLDVGCGTGKSLDWFLNNGIDASGLEGSEMAIKHSCNPHAIRKVDLAKPVDLGKRFDLVWCFEVAEHIHPEYTGQFTSTLVTHSDQILISAAHPGQGGVGHFNEQPRSYWLEHFDGLGYWHDDATREEIVRNWDWHPENIFFFRKRTA